ncbi:MAG: hypothetical protein ACP5MH_11945 [Thermoproteus sp.]
MSEAEIWIRRLEELKRAIEEGRRVLIGDTLVRKIEYMRTRRGGVVVIINDGEIIDYASRLLLRKIEIK